jgi:hypothetical protein
MSSATVEVSAYLVTVASLSEPSREHVVIRCLACGKRLEASLSVVGSLRCLDCRDAQVPLNPELVALWQQRSSQG